MKPEYARCVLLDIVDPIRDLFDKFFPNVLQTKLFHVEAGTPRIRHAFQDYGITYISDIKQTGQQKGRTQIIDLRRKIFPNAMHDYQRIACSPVPELLQKLVEDIVVALHERVRFGGEKFVSGLVLRKIPINLSTSAS